MVDVFYRDENTILEFKVLIGKRYIVTLSPDKRIVHFKSFHHDRSVTYLGEMEAEFGCTLLDVDTSYFLVKQKLNTVIWTLVSVSYNKLHSSMEYNCCRKEILWYRAPLGVCVEMNNKIKPFLWRVFISLLSIATNTMMGSVSTRIIIQY